MVGERRLQPPTRWRLAMREDELELAPDVQRYQIYIDGLLRDLGAAPTRLQLDRLKVRLVDRFYKETANGVAAQLLMPPLLAALDRIKERELDLEPPELVERIVVRDPTPSTLSLPQAVGFFLDVDEG